MKEKIPKDIYNAIKKIRNFCLNYECDFCPLYTKDIESPCILFERPCDWVYMIKCLNIDIVENNERDNK